MAKAVKKTLDLNKFGIKSVPKEIREDVKERVAELVVDEILQKVSDGASPVSGETFKKLNAKYADKEHGGDRTPRMELEGDMLDALDTRIKGNKVEVGIWGREAAKADGHNRHHGRNANLPKRRFIPKGDQNFKKDVVAEIKRTINEAKDGATREAVSPLTTQERDELQDVVNDIFREFDLGN